MQCNYGGIPLSRIQQIDNITVITDQAIGVDKCDIGVLEFVGLIIYQNPLRVLSEITFVSLVYHKEYLRTSSSITYTCGTL